MEADEAMPTQVVAGDYMFETWLLFTDNTLRDLTPSNLVESGICKHDFLPIHVCPFGPIRWHPVVDV